MCGVPEGAYIDRVFRNTNVLKKSPTLIERPQDAKAWGKEKKKKKDTGSSQGFFVTDNHLTQKRLVLYSQNVTLKKKI